MNGIDGMTRVLFVASIIGVGLGLALLSNPFLSFYGFQMVLLSAFGISRSVQLYAMRP